jgi:putative transposase
MRYDLSKHHRRSLRLEHYDYSQAGVYFVTICTHQREHLFGKITKGEMHLNTFGQVAFDEWIKTETVRTNIIIDEYVVMPNHIHGIILIQNSPQNNVDDVVGACGPHAQKTQPPSNGILTAPRAGSLGAIMAQYKSIVTKRIQKLHGEKIPVWQRNYYERIIRDDGGLSRARQYIINNPIKWESDVNFNPTP